MGDEEDNPGYGPANWKEDPQQYERTQKVIFNLEKTASLGEFLLLICYVKYFTFLLDK